IRCSSVTGVQTCALPISGRPLSAECLANAVPNANTMKKDVSFVEVYGKVNYTINDSFSVGATEFYSPNFLNSGAWGNYASITGRSEERRVGKESEGWMTT